tara:strand:+ start:278 stop:1309 length:1032 start_codon:yes stop_codon:yes gene_type:complete
METNWDLLIENHFDKKETLAMDMLVEMVEDMMSEATGQENEQYLVDAVKNVVAETGGPVPLRIGNLGTFEIKDAKKEGGGNPEPKADVILHTTDGKEVAISMKKENYAFSGNWLNKKTLREMLVSPDSGFEEDEADILINNLIEDITEFSIKNTVLLQEERDKFEKAVQQIDPTYQFPNPIKKGSDLFKKLVDAKIVKAKGTGGTQYIVGIPVPNHYYYLDQILEGGKYKKFAAIVIGGHPKINPKPADGVLIADVKKGITDIGELQNILDKTMTIPEAVDYYDNHPEALRLKFRFRPITLTKTVISADNRRRYNAYIKDKERWLYADPKLGVAWWLFVTKGK